MVKKAKSASPEKAASTTCELSPKARTLDFATFEGRLIVFFPDGDPLKWARKHGFPPTTVSDFLARRSIPKAELLAQISRAENVSVDWLLGLSEHRGAIPAPALDAELLAQVLGEIAGQAIVLGIALSPEKHARVAALAYKQALAGTPLDAAAIGQVLILAK